MALGKILSGIAGLTLIGSLPAEARTITVHPGQSIQSAVNKAVPGDRVRVLAGTYRETGVPCPQNGAITCGVVISADNISLEAAGHGQPVVLQNAGGQGTGVVVAKQNVDLATCLDDQTQHINGSTISGFTVHGFDDGIVLFCVDNWSVNSNIASANSDYGIFPLFSANGRLTGNFASGANDTGIYIGESHDVRVDHNIATGNVAGFEVENSYRVTADHNTAHHNTGGLLMFIIPGLHSLVGHDNQLRDNAIFSNNRANTCVAGDDVCLIPPGTGILAVAGSTDVISHNTVVDNETGGIGLLNACVAFQLTSDQCAAIGYDPSPESTRIASNVVLGNGKNPQSPLLPGADLLWDGTGNGNCWHKNEAKLVVPPVLPVCSK